MSEHKPGPWWWDSRQAGMWRSERGQADAACDFGSCYYYCHEPQLPSKADASVIAAAPDLLALVEEAIRLYGTPHWWNQPHAPAEWIARAQAAVAKAQGTMASMSSERSEGGGTMTEQDIQRRIDAAVQPTVELVSDPCQLADGTRAHLSLFMEAGR